MATRVRCLRCLKIIECSPYDTQILLDHIRAEHPEIELPDDEMEDRRRIDKTPAMGDAVRLDEVCSTKPPQPQPGGVMEEETIRNINQKPMYTRRYKIHSPPVARSPQKRRLYRTSIEKWRPAKGTIFCPKCGVNKKPIVRSRSEKVSQSSAGAACILTCWPLCFFPCLFPAPAKEYLHCAECNNFLGMYDKHNNCVRPNREFTEDFESRSSGKLSRASDRPSDVAEESCMKERQKEVFVEVHAPPVREVDSSWTQEPAHVTAVKGGRPTELKFAKDPLQ